MVSIEEVITELKRLTPAQVEEVARLIGGFSRLEGSASSPPPVVPASVIEEAVKNGWPAELFTEVIGSLPDFKRPEQPPFEDRAPL